MDRIDNRLDLLLNFNEPIILDIRIRDVTPQSH